MNARWRDELIAWGKGIAAATPIAACLFVAAAATGWVALVAWVGFFAGAAMLFVFGLRAMVELWREEEDHSSGDGV